MQQIHASSKESKIARGCWEVKAAVEGRLPRGYSLKRLVDLPMAWPDQWQALRLLAPER
jgi:hypothetical protein